MSNERFYTGKPEAHNFLAEQRASAEGQYPAAVLLSCIDSRVAAETIMDLNNIATAAFDHHNRRGKVIARLGEPAEVLKHRRPRRHQRKMYRTVLKFPPAPID